MSDKTNPYQNPWDDGVYGTGRTTPPKNHGGTLAVLLILVIFLSGIVTVLSILNIRMFQRLQVQEEQTPAITFEEETATESTAAPESPTEQAAAAAPLNIDLQASPASTDNVAENRGLPLQQIYEKNIPSVVSISCSGPQSASSGTGVVLSRDGYLVTKAHVVEGAYSITVRLSDDREFPARIVGRDQVSDLAVLSIDAADLTPACFGDSDSLRVGDSVVAIGDPLGAELRGTMTDGIVSAINRDVTVDGRTMSLIQTNAALNSGNSGGPLIDCYGQVVGINTLKIGSFVDRAGVEGLGFAIPSATVKTIVDQLISQGYVSGRPTLGLSGETLSAFYQHYYRLPAGLLITQVESLGPADQAGLLPGDVLVTLGDTAVSDMNTLNAVLSACEIGDTIRATVYRSGKQGTVYLTVEEAKN